ncbi:hypothetical protein KKH27_10900 [bacterium]|nr:hypothetical protein [bacterium]MBU1983586.1 hypothetical protein [bacterium]
MIRLLFGVLVLTFVMAGQSPAAPAEFDDVPELSSVLSVFTARATSGNGVRLNWTLDRQSPTILGFRLYRGYEEVGNFAVLAEIGSHSAASDVEYSYQDASARPGVSYFYKLAAVGQRTESVFPVVITATPLTQGHERDRRELAPASIIPGERIALYVREAGRTKLDVLTPPGKALVDDVLQPGIYEFDPPSEPHQPMTLRVSHETGFTEEVIWPLE